MTPLERRLLLAIFGCEYHDGTDPIDNPVWTESVVDVLPAASRGGVCASLVKKGWATFHVTGNPRQDTCTITQAGVLVLALRG